MSDEIHEDRTWLDDGSEPQPNGKRWQLRRKVATFVSIGAAFAVIGVPLGLALSGGSPAALPPVKHHLHTSNASHVVLKALASTVAAGNFDFTYQFSRTAATTVPVSTTSATMPGGPSSPAPSLGAATCPRCRMGWTKETVTSSANILAGHGIVDLSPIAMAATVIPGINIWVGATKVWEGSANATLEPTAQITSPGVGMSGTSGQLITNFISAVTGELGTRDGTLALDGMSSPSGFLSLTQNEITDTSPSGASTLSGVPVHRYTVTVDNNQVMSTPLLSPSEKTTIGKAQTILVKQGYTDTLVTVDIDASGYIRQAAFNAHFSDGGVATLTVTLSNIGCAGTVVLPGETGTPGVPAGCISPDAPQTSTSSTTSTSTVTPAKVHPTNESTTTISFISPPATSTTTTTTISFISPPATSTATTTTVPPGTSATSTVPTSSTTTTT